MNSRKKFNVSVFTRIADKQQNDKMADDGMLLNFSIGEMPLVQKQKLKGGSWRARRDVYRLSKRSLNAKASNQSTNAGEPIVLRATSDQGKVVQRSGIDSILRPTKRQKTENASRTERSEIQRSKEDHIGDSRAGDKQVISSLFRFNPTSTTKTLSNSESTRPQADIAPSNAPLPSELENFTSLGVTRSLAAHLTQKLAIKRPTAIQKSAIPTLLKDDSDVFIQAETGSGKTLAYVLPLVQRIMELAPTASTSADNQNEGKGEGIHRDSGLFAVILTPTRELSRQVSNVLSSVLPPYLVCGTVIGGEKKKSEKARLRKGLNVLIATPGRLADHLDHTEALDVSRVRWLVLDEGDRLMELGFEEEIKKIVSKLDFRLQKSLKEVSAMVLPKLPTRRITVLCSATMRMDVQRLGEISLKDARHIKADTSDELQDQDTVAKDLDDKAEFTAPAQLKQSFAVTPAKLRLVTLMAMLKQTFARAGAVTKVIIFLSCADSVDFHFDVLTRIPEDSVSHGKSDTKDTGPPLHTIRNSHKPQSSSVTSNPSDISSIKTFNPSYYISPTLSDQVTVYRLHGSLPPSLRTSTLKSFYSSVTPAILLCTDVASRGLDLPNVDLVIEFDPAFSRDDHLHRIGRTARAGKDGRACVFLMPGAEEGYVDILAQERRDGAAGVRRSDADEILKKAFSPTAMPHNRDAKTDHKSWEDAATNAQLDIERWILTSPSILEKARRAYTSHVRAYATHVVAERKYFDLKELHLGHLAKAFGLRDRPGVVNVRGIRAGSDKRRPPKTAESSRREGRAGVGEREDVVPGTVDIGEMARKMRAMGRGVMGGVDEFNLG